MQECHISHLLIVVFMPKEMWEGYAQRWMTVLQANCDGGRNHPTSVYYCAGQNRWGQATPDFAWMFFAYHEQCSMFQRRCTQSMICVYISLDDFDYRCRIFLSTCEKTTSNALTFWLMQPVIVKRHLDNAWRTRTSHRVDAHMPRLIHVGLCFYNISLTDVTWSMCASYNICHLTDVLWPWQNLHERCTHPMIVMNERCAQVTTGAGRQQATLTEQCAQTTTNLGDPWPISHGRCLFSLTFLAQSTQALVNVFCHCTTSLSSKWCTQATNHACKPWSMLPVVGRNHLLDVNMPRPMHGPVWSFYSFALIHFNLLK